MYKKSMRIAAAGLVGLMTAAAFGGTAMAEEKMGDLVIAGMASGSAMYDYAIEKFLEKYPDVTVETPLTETAQREQVLKTAIAAGDPATVCQYWGTRVNSFYDNGMCLDLSDYIDPALVEMIDPAMLEPCLGENGEIWAIPSDTVYHVVYYNKEMMDEYGYEEPTTWEEFTAIFADLKEKDIFGYSTNSASMQDCLYGITYGELDAKVGEGTAYGVANGDVSVAPGSEAGEVIRECIEQVQSWYDAGYWYPGDSGISCTADDANAAFAQGRCMFIFNYSGSIATLQNSCEFEIGMFMKPTSSADIVSKENIEPSVWFIPANCTEEQINTGVAFIETLLSQECQQKIVDENNIPSIVTYEFENISPILTELFSNFGQLQAGLNPTRTSSEMQTFVKQMVFAGPCGGTMTIDETLEEMERIRLAAQ